MLFTEKIKLLYLVKSQLISDCTIRVTNYAFFDKKGVLESQKNLAIMLNAFRCPIPIIMRIYTHTMPNVQLNCHEVTN